MEITLILWYILLPYAILVGAFILFALFNLYHMLAYGFLSFESFFATFLFLGGTIIVLFLTYQLLAGVNWSLSTMIGPF